PWISCCSISRGCCVSRRSWRAAFLAGRNRNAPFGANRTGRFSRACHLNEDDLLTLHLGMHHRARGKAAGEDLLGQALLDPELDPPIQLTRAISRVLTYGQQRKPPLIGQF